MEQIVTETLALCDALEQGEYDAVPHWELEMLAHVDGEEDGDGDPDGDPDQDA